MRLFNYWVMLSLLLAGIGAFGYLACTDHLFYGICVLALISGMCHEMLNP